MSQVSKRKVQEEVLNGINQVFIEALTSLEKSNNFSAFLDEFLTPTEKVMLSKRFMIAYMIESGYSYNQIIELIKVSSSTINKVESNYRNSILMRSLVKKFVKSKKLNTKLLDAGILVSSLLDFPKSKTKTWKAIHRDLKNKRASRL